MPAETVFAICFLISWIVLAVCLIAGYAWLRKYERDTRLPQENGQTPRLEVIGAGRINRRQWSRGHGCRVSVYESLLVVSVSSQRLAFPLYRLRDVETPPGSADRLTLRVLAEDESLVTIEFRGAAAAELASYLRQQGRDSAKVAGRA